MSAAPWTAAEEDKRWRWRDSQTVCYVFRGLAQWKHADVGVSRYFYPPGREDSVRFTAHRWGASQGDSQDFIDVSLDPVSAAKMACRILRVVNEIDPDTVQQAMHLLNNVLPL